MLLHVCGEKSYHDLRTVNGVLFPSTFKEAAVKPASSVKDDRESLHTQLMTEGERPTRCLVCESPLTLLLPFHPTLSTVALQRRSSAEQRLLRRFPRLPRMRQRPRHRRRNNLSDDFRYKAKQHLHASPPLPRRQAAPARRPLSRRQAAPARPPLHRRGDSRLSEKAEPDERRSTESATLQELAGLLRARNLDRPTAARSVFIQEPDPQSL